MLLGGCEVSTLHQKVGIVQMSFLREANTAFADMCCFHGNEWSDHHSTRCMSSLYMTELADPDTCTHTRAIRFIWHISLFSMLSEPLHVFVLLLDSLLTARGSQLDSEERGHSSRDLYPRAIILLEARWQRSLL